MASAFSLNEKIALITGAGRGLGFEIAKALAAAGALVIVNGRTAEPLERAVSRIASLGGSAAALQFDISDESAVKEAFGRIRNTHAHLDILVNNVGIRDRRGLFDFEITSVRRLVETDLIAPFNLCREAARLMIDQGEGRIINITSIAGRIARPGDAVYTAAKGGLEALTRALAAELGPFGITVNAVAPGFFATEANTDMVRDEKITAWLKSRTSLGRWGNPDEIGGVVTFLATSAASYITGQVIAVDGGYLAHY